MQITFFTSNKTVILRSLLHLTLVVALVLLNGTTALADSYVFTTLAGLAGSSGSADGTNSTARFYRQGGVALDSAGNVYVTDDFNHTIRKITPSGVVSTLAGLAGSSGSADGTNSDARFSTPAGVAVDSAGNAYVADYYNHTIRKVTPAGAVTTLAGLAGNPGSTDGTNSMARFNQPHSLAVDSAGNIYVTDLNNRTIRKMTPNGANWLVTTLAGLAGSSGSTDGTNNTARFNIPIGVAADSSGNLYVTDDGDNTIRKVTTTGVVTTLAGLAGVSGSADGTNSAARFNGPVGVAVDGVGNIYVSDWSNATIRKLTPNGANWVVTTLAGLAGNTGSTDGTGSATRFNMPSGVAVDSAGNLYVSDYWNSTIRKGVNQAPYIIQSPTNQIAVVGGNVTFSVNATGVAPLYYQWFKGGAVIPNATNSAFSLQPLALGPVLK